MTTSRFLCTLLACLFAGSALADEAKNEPLSALSGRFSWQSPLGTSGYFADKNWAQGLRVVGGSQDFWHQPSAPSLSNPGLKFPNTYLGLGYGYSLLPNSRLDFYADVGVTMGLSALGSGVSASPTPYELTSQRYLRDMFGGLSLVPSASIGLVYRY